MLKVKFYFYFTAVLFSLIALLHVVRLLNEWEAVIGGWRIPMTASAVGFIIAAALAWEGFRLGNKS